MKMRAATFAASVAMLTGLTVGASAQTEDSQQAAERALIERVVIEGCAPPKINAALRRISFDAMAEWLNRGRHEDEARKIQAISRSEGDLYDAIEPTVVKTVVGLVVATDRAGAWDAGRNLTLAATLLGGQTSLIRYVQAARDLHLAVHTAPARYLYENQGGNLTGWVAESQPSPQAMSLTAGLNEMETRAAFEIPYRVGSYLRAGQDYSAPVTADPTATVSVSTQAYRAMEETRVSEARKIATDPTIPLRQTLAQKLTKPQSNQTPPTDDADRALTFAAWLPRICLNYQTVFTPALVSRKIIGEKYIVELKAKNAW
jgi:hypothetical protein